MQKTYTLAATLLVISSTLIAGAGCAPQALEQNPGAGEEHAAPTATNENMPEQGMQGELASGTREIPPNGMMKPTDPTPLTDEQSKELEAGAAPHEPTTLTFDVSGGNFWFSPNEIRVKKGDTVKIRFLNTGGTHNFVLDEFNVGFTPNHTGETTEAQFVADKAGTFEFYCSVGSHRALGMKGTLIVEE